MKFDYESALQVVKAHLEKEGIVHYTAYPANNCVGVSYGRISAYYIVEDNKVKDVVYD